MQFSTEDDLKADGFVLTVNVFHGGNGIGKVYEKIVEGGRVFYSVDVDGTVAMWYPPSADAPQVVDVVAPEVPVSAEVSQPQANPVADTDVAVVSDPEVAEPEVEAAD